MGEPRTECRVCRATILAATAERTGGLCAPCDQAAHPIRFEFTPEDESRSQAIDEIRSRLLAGCSAEEFAAMRCPVCGAGLGLNSRPRAGASMVIHVVCLTSSKHLGFHAGSPVAPEWWAEHRSGGWLTDPA